MLANSYLILGPNGPTDIAAAAMTQRHTIPLVWAFLTAADGARFVEGDGNHYFALNVDGALKILDRGTAAWNYNSYFRDTLAPVSVFRKWLANYPPETPLYINVTELIRRSPTPEQDVESLNKLGDRVEEAFQEIEAKEFSHFINDLRLLAHPFITVPITGNRERDVYLLKFEVRDTASVEAEMALQLVGVDRDKSMLRAAVESIPHLLRNRGPVSETAIDVIDEPPLTLFASDAESAAVREFFVDGLGMTLQGETAHQLHLEAKGRHLRVVKLSEPTMEIVEEETGS